MGIISEVIANNTRKPIWGYKSLVYSSLALGFISFIVWAHHMYLTGMGTKIATFFQTTTMMISIPSVIILDVFVDFALGRLHPVQYSDALRPGVPADVRHRRSDGFAARF
ncbi:MAG: cbb3-type cytochrome c oxidase subunit I [Verrucomicrobiota bacterium]